MGFGMGFGIWDGIWDGIWGWDGNGIWDLGWDGIWAASIMLHVSVHQNKLLIIILLKQSL